LKPLAVTGTIGTFDVQIDALGGGKSGQAGAMRLGIARALVTYNEELRPTLRIAELLTRDPRMVERKKYGRKKARKRFQFSKR
jgi:small subunit ribosomal protein S9